MSRVIDSYAEETSFVVSELQVVKAWLARRSLPEPTVGAMAWSDSDTGPLKQAWCPLLVDRETMMPAEGQVTAKRVRAASVQ